MRNLLIILFFTLSFSFPLLCQDTIKNIVFEGAGMKGLAYAGALEELENRNKLNYLEKVGGTSAGAIIALSLSLGYSPQEIQNIIYETDFNKFNRGYFGGIKRTITRFGFYKTKKVDDWLGSLVKEKTGDRNTTFKDLNENGYLNLYSVATLLDQQKQIVYSVETHPKMKIKDAVRASMSIPMYFEAMFIDNQGKPHKTPKECDSCHTVIDGGMVANFPIHIFDTIIDGKRIANKNTLGIRIDDDEQISYDKKRKGLAPKRIKNFKNFTLAFYDLLLETANRSYLTEDDWKRTISVSSGTIGPKIKKLNLTEKNLLINNGVIGVKEYFEE